jgi:uncharacterized protein YbjT (DUF2867 family)
MIKILLFGATGHLGKEIAKIAIQKGYDLTAVVRNKTKADEISALTQKCIIADVTKADSINGICKGFDIVISAFGKSVSPNDNSKPSFADIDLNANTYILKDAQKSGVKKFVYVSALHAEKHLHLEYFRVHHEFSQRLIASGINYTIIKPPAIFSGFIDMIDMAKKGMLFNIGSGDKKTNPIYELDLAIECVKSISEDNIIKEIGGKSIYTRKQLYDIIQKEVCPSKSVKHVPLWLYKLSLPLIKYTNKNLYDKLAFFAAVIQEDTIAPQIGPMKFEDYVKLKK